MPILWDASGDAKADLDRLGARIASLDLVITCDNTTAHIAGAVGTPCRVLLPVASDWRWGSRKREHRLYQSVRLFWNANPVDWSDLADQVEAVLLEVERRLTPAADPSEVQRNVPMGRVARGYVKCLLAGKPRLAA